MKLLMHTCCAPCSTYVIKRLREEGYTDITSYWYNINIHPYEEYKQRLETLKMYTKMVNIPLIVEDDYGLREFVQNVADNIDGRCYFCYKSRLEKTVKYAKENGYDSFTTTLLVSPYQKHEMIIKVCEGLAKEYGIEFVYFDFRVGFREGQQMARDAGLYMQKYCGCVFSEEEAQRQREQRMEMKHIRVLWNYMKMNQKLKHADCIIALGTADTAVAKVAAQVYLDGYADKIIFSGGLGKITYQMWNETEAEKFAKIAMDLGVPKEAIYLEKKSTNTGDNFRFTKELIEKEKLNMKSCIVVCKSSAEKRAYAAFQKIMPEYEVIMHSENIRAEDYYQRMGMEYVNDLVASVQRMKVYAERGWQIPMEVPDEVWNAYEELVKRGYDKYTIKGPESDDVKMDVEKRLSAIQ